jgi:hypothetical protein
MPAIQNLALDYKGPNMGRYLDFSSETQIREGKRSQNGLPRERAPKEILTKYSLCILKEYQNKSSVATAILIARIRRG